jgi:tripartite-type tricarboxylate transporter receptor subunit TctC
MHRRNFVAGALALPVLGRTARARAASGPLTRIIFPFAAGGGGDALCRLVAQEMGQSLDRTIIVDNRTGADGLIGIKTVQTARPDGAMVLVTTGPTMYLLPMVETHPSFDTEKDFVPVSLLTRFEFGIVAGPAVNADAKQLDFKGLVAWLRAHPKQATFGVPANGTIPHFAGSKLEQILGIPLTRVAYRGSAPVINDLLAGTLPFGVTTIADAMPQHKADTVKIVAVSSAARSPFLPDVPTLKESGIDLVADGWYGMWLPAGSSTDFASKLSSAAATALAKPDVKQKLTDIGLIPVGSTPEGLSKEVANDIALWGPIVKATGYKVDN